jgi:hypothetical protein
MTLTAAAEASVVVVLAVAVMSSVGASELDQLEAVSVAAASTQPRCSVACADPLQWERAEAELASAYRATLRLDRVRYIGGPSIIIKQSPDP